jgi:hypothetical protein
MSAMGYGYGSECHLLRWMGRHRNAFDVGVRSAMGKSTGSVSWLDVNFAPKKDWPDAELKGLEFIDDPGVKSEWRSWWPHGAGIHNWDAVGWWGQRAAKEIILVEAKANLAEIRSPCNAKPEGGRGRIEQSLTETAVALGVQSIDSWLTDHYQLANRLAAIHFLKGHGYQPHLLLVYFVGDKGNTSRVTPQSPDEWAAPLAEQKKQMGLPVSHPLSECVKELFLHISERSAWLRPDSTSRINFG